MDDQELQRYARHILLPEIGGAGQTRLLGARVLVIGAGGLGSPVILYLAASGVGTIGIIDDDDVDLSNLQRQIAHATTRLGAPKADSASEAASSINPNVILKPIRQRLDTANAAAIIADYDIVADGSDNFETRFLINDACYLGTTTLVSAAILRFDGQLSTFKPHAGDSHPCYRCLFPEPPPEGMVPTCAEAGVLGALCGVMGSLQAAEVIKEITGAGNSMSGSLLIFDGLATEFRKIKIRPDPGCALCGPDATIKALS
ncbi:MAG: molybdopterin-synthase adenylyltransferase MoeB [Pseudomonadota bacterium]|nr:molybdopterin-synthase adenylyltransferase MoeB [Pseudomonadota bacterium]